MKYSYLFLLIFTLLSTSFYSQDDEEEEDPACMQVPSDKKVLKLYEKGMDRKKYSYKERMRALKDALELDEDCSACMWEIAKLTYRRAQANGDNFEIPQKYYHMIEATCPEFHADVYYNLGVMYYAQKADCMALEYFEKFSKFPSDDEKRLSRKYSTQLEDVGDIKYELDFYCNYFKDKKPFFPKVVQNVSTATRHEYLPMISADNEILLYTAEFERKFKGDVMTEKVQEFTMSTRPEANVLFGKGVKMPKPFNVGPRYGGATISLNNKELFICSCTKQAGIFNCDIFSTKYEMVEVDGKDKMVWSELENLGPNINGPDTWEAQPSLSADGKTLYFASARAESIQQSIDIYYSEKQEDGTWGKAINCGRPINTIGNDKAPFMHSDSKTLYFVSQCSQERLGAGGYDLFYTRQQDDGSWDRPKNIGYPINTEGDEEGIIVSTDGNHAYLSSNGIKGGIGKKDIFSFSLPEEAKPDKVIIMKGKVSTENIEEVKDTKLKVRYESGKVVEQEILIDDEGDYVAVANVGDGKEDVLIEIEKEGKAYESKLIKKEETSRTFIKEVEIEIKEIKKGSKHTINDILFGSNSSEIDAASKLVLKGFANWLNLNPSIKIEIQGHTDDVGKDADNLALSQDRAYSVMEYLSVEGGIKASRIKFKGYGETKPKVPNNSTGNRKKNRRTDFLIL